MTPLLAFGFPQISGTELAFTLFVLSLQSLLIGGLWLYPIIECAVHHPKGPQKDLWILFITIIPLLGGLIYLVLGRPADPVPPAGG